MSESLSTQHHDISHITICGTCRSLVLVVMLRQALAAALASLLIAVPPDSSAFVVVYRPPTAVGLWQHHCCCCHPIVTRGKGAMAATMDSSLRTSWPTVAGESQLSVSNADEGYELNGLLNVRHTECKSVWILCHGLCSSLHGTVSRFVSEKLDANTFRFDFAGCGQSGGDWKYAGYDRELSDLRAVVLHLRKMGWTVNCVLGHSKGAAAVLRYGEKYDDVPLIVNVCGRFNTSKTPRSRFTEEQWQQLEETGSFIWNVKGKEFLITRTDFEERAALDMKRTASAIKRSKVLTIHGTEDETIPVADAYEFGKLILQHELVVIEGGTHRFATEPEQAAVMKALAPLVQQQ